MTGQNQSRLSSVPGLEDRLPGIRGAFAAAVDALDEKEGEFFRNAVKKLIKAVIPVFYVAGFSAGFVSNLLQAVFGYASDKLGISLTRSAVLGHNKRYVDNGKMAGHDFVGALAAVGAAISAPLTVVSAFLSAFEGLVRFLVPNEMYPKFLKDEDGEPLESIVTRLPSVPGSAAFNVIRDRLRRGAALEL